MPDACEITPLSFRSSLALLRVPSFAPTTVAILFTVFSEAIAGSYMALLAVQKIGMSPLELGAFLTLSAISGIAVTTLFGHWHDRRPVLWPLILALLAKIVGYALCGIITDTWMLLAIAFVLFGLSNAAFPLLFAIAKGYLDKAGGEAPARGMASLRMTSSLGWAVGPAVGALMVAAWGFSGVYLGAAVLAVVALGTIWACRITPQPASTEPKARVTLDVVKATAPAVLSLAAFHTVMFMGSNATSITVVSGLGTETDVGLIFSLCAALEVLVMGAFVVNPAWVESRLLLVTGFAMFAVYFVLLLAVPTLEAIYWGQVPRAIAIGIISVLGMAQLQHMLPDRAGVAAALFGNTASAGFLLSGLGTGTLAGAFGYGSIFIACAVLSILGGLVLIGSPRRAVQPASARQ